MMGQGKDQSEKYVLFFQELKKGLGLNKTNGKMCSKLFGSEEMDDWIGKKIALYVKDDVEYAGEIVSAIRVRSKLPGAPAVVNGEDYSTLTFEETVYRIDHAESLKEIGALMLHGVSLRVPIEQMNTLTEAKNSRVNALMGISA